MLVIKIFAVFFMAMAVGVLYRIPRKSIVYASLTGVLGWSMVFGLVEMKVSIVMANFLGGVTIGLCAEILARSLKKPATVFIIPGFIPLVPGREAYTTMLNMVNGEYTQGVAWGMQTMLTGGAIAFGLFVSSTAYRLFMTYLLRSKLTDVGESKGIH